ncbi:HesA/MoeB/ThiF family protein [Inhella gelatinilytica]|uniref:Molybdopterin-synthase adenylyltransferase n=1 Tax=Inhella gelatinilytica TaxID=2795030 RepID=A0A931IZB1_9BURK|nr:HesA/MoeB/ThiF family protein [Inhella gelatinilytica]MBH9552556.1 HesA/MoeB/ThiF family protein [Inhella gelatinilytica]
MTDTQLLRYARHLLLNEWGVEAQERVLGSHALVIGAGGLGSPALLYLASAGVGHITVVDPDTVELSNLQRQIAHADARVGWSKVGSAQSAIHALNPDLRVTALHTRADAQNLPQWVAHAQVVLDCSDNFRTRQAVNAACVAAGKPLVWAAGVGWDAQASVYDPAAAQCPCYACLFPPEAPVQDTHCATQGVFAPLVGIAGTLQAAEALKLLAGLRSGLAGRLWLFDGQNCQTDQVGVQASANCPVCAPHRASTAHP